MDLIDSFLARLRPSAPQAAPPAPPLPPEQMGPLVTRLWRIGAKAQLPHFSDEERRALALLLDPELRGIANECSALLRRRTDLGAAIGLSADALDGLVRLGLELETLARVAADVAAAAETALGAFRGALGAWNARVLLFVQERVADSAVPLAERQALLYRFQGALGEEEKIGAGRRPGRRPGIRIDELRRRVEAARDSKAVLGALRLLRGALGQGGER